MHWQFGGNFEPVQMICENDWKECPKAIGNYIWSEIVTDVLDCLRNEGIVWRVLAVSLICTVLLHLTFSKTKHVNNAVAENEILDKVGYKVEDLELKVNILTYKMQYGSWPMPHQIHKSNFKKNLRNLRLTLSSPNDRNDWIKNVLLSPRRNDSYGSCPKYNYPSGQRLTELFDKKKPMYPYLRREALPLEHSSKSSKSSSEISLKPNSVFKRTVVRKQSKISKSENFEVQNQNAFLPSLCSRKKHSKSMGQINKDTKEFGTEKLTWPCKKFSKTMDECKRYLKELHDSNKNLGLVGSSSEASDDSSMKNVWSKTQGMCTQQKDLVGDKFEGNEPNEKETNIEEETNSKETNLKQQNKENCLKLSNAIYPILKLIDKRLRPSKMNITFCTEMFPPKSVSNILIPQSCEQKKFMETSQEALYQVKKKLESLHNVLRTYAIQNPDPRGTRKQQEYNEQIDNICQNVRDTLVLAATETEKWNEKKRNKVSFDTDTGKISDEMQQTIYISSEQYESDETGKSSDLSVQNYSNVFNTCYPHNINDFHWSFLKKSDNTIYSPNNQKSNGVIDDGYPSTIKYDKIPERIYYTISSDLFDETDTNGETTVTKNYALPDIYNESNRIESFNFSNQHTVPIETDEDLIQLSPTSSRTEISKDSESDDKSTALLLQEALQFKKALLTRVELDKVYYIDDSRENINSESMSEYSKCSYVNNNLQSKFLDIISEEQSLSSSTDKTNRTYMFFNIKQNKQLPHSSTFGNNVIDFTHQNEIKNQNLHGGYFDSKQNLCSSSKYFSFSNVSQEENKMNANKLFLSKHNYLQGNEFAEMVPSNLQIKYLNHALDKSDKKVMEMNFTNCLKHVDTNMNEREICYNYENEGENSETNFLRTNNTNELINCNIDSVELFSHNLNETLYDEENQNSNKNEGCNFLDSESLEQCTNASSMKGVENDLLNTKLNLSNNEKYIEENEILMSSPNLSLKRHLGACSLIEQTLVKTSTENTAERHMLIGKVDAIYELSPSESRENSIETNLIQDSLTSSINNHSNNSNIPEPSSVTVLINKSTDEEELNLNWSNVKNNFSNDCINEKNTQTISTNTITLQKYDYIGIENYDKQEPTCNQDTISAEKYRETDIRYDQSTFKDGQNSSVTEHSLTDLGNQNSTNEADFCRSYSNLISPHSSLYFTDEASSSTAKLNNSYSKHFQNNLHLNLDTQTGNKEAYYQDKDSKDTENTDLLSISLSNESKKIVTMTIANTQKSGFKVLDKKQDIDQKLSDSYNKTNNKTDLTSSKNYRNVSLSNKTEQTSKKENEMLSDKASTSYISTNNHTLLSPKNMNSGDKAQSSVLLNKPNTINVDQNMFLLKTLGQISPREIKENITLKRMNTTIKSKNQENYTLKAEKLKKPVTQQIIKGLKSDLNNKVKSNSMPTHVNVKDLSVQSKHNTECNINLNKRKSQSQISFRLNESAKHVTSQSYESPRNKNTINNTHSLDTKLKNHIKSLLPTPKTSSKSCIPILKSRLEAARRSENETRPKSPMRGPLTMTMLWRDNFCRKNHNVMEESIKVESKSENNEQCAEEINNCVRKTDDNWNHTDKQNLIKASYSVQNLCTNINNNIDPQEQMVIYVNIYTKYDQNTTKIVDPNKFLEYIKTRELNVEKVTTENQSNKIDIEFSTDSTEKEKSIMHKIVTIVSSVINGNELDQNKSPDLSAPTAKTESLTNTLSNAKLKHLCFLSVEQREIDVTAKPSVIDTSTSISDLEKVSETSESMLNKFQICGTPKELNNDEYIALLEILHQEPNIVHLQDLQNVCKKLISEYKKPE